MYKIFIFCLVFVSVAIFSVSASTIPSGFLVEVNPSNFAVNEAVDVTIKALASDGSVIVDYNGFVFVDILSSTPGVSLSYDDVVVPWQWLVVFEPVDLWEKVLSKSLIVRKPWSYVLKVYDLDDERLSWQRDIVVGQLQQSATSPITIVSPTSWWIERLSAINILATAVWLSNSPYQLLLNGIPSVTWITDAQWSIATILTGLQAWLNSLQIRMVDINNILLWESQLISFTYESSTDQFFNWIQILPWTQAKQWDKLIFMVSTSDDVSTVELLLGMATAIPMDRESAWNFIKQVTLEQEWVVPVSLRLIAWWNTKMYNDVASLTVDKNIAIWPIRFYTESIDRSSITLSWQVFWQSPRFLLKYGINKDNLNQEMSIETNEVQITNIVPTNVYYFQIIPVDQNWSIIGTPSDIIEVDPSLLQSDVTCIVDGILLTTESIDDKYYFVWDPVENAQKYIIYRSSYMTSILSEMRKVWETTQTRFEYPFNTQAINQEFAYYAVVAVCGDGKEILIDEIKKVEVWPYDSFIIVFILSILVYSMWFLYKRS
jgi:hypothetical protein